MAENRLARELGNREATQRTKVWQPPTTLPSPAPREGWKHRWIRTSMVNFNDHTNVSAKLREGWEPVRSEDYPELMLSADPTSRFKGNVEVGGLLLCRAPVEMVEQRNSYYGRQAHSQMEAVDNSFMKQNDERMPLFNERRTSVTFGSGK